MKTMIVWAFAMCLVALAPACAMADPPDPDLVGDCVRDCKLETQRPEPECVAECLGAQGIGPWGFCACAAPAGPEDCPSVPWHDLEARCQDAKLCPLAALLHPLHVRGYFDGLTGVACGFPPTPPSLYLATMACDTADPRRVLLFCE